MLIIKETFYNFNIKIKSKFSFESQDKKLILATGKININVFLNKQYKIYKL